VRASTVAVGLLAISVLGSGCFGANRYAKYQNRKAAIRKIDELIATIPHYPGARLAGRQDFSTNYKVGVDHYIDAEPYSSDLYYDLSKSISGATLERYFRRVMIARGWSCSFQRRSHGVPYGFGCRRAQAVVGAYIADHGHYELDVAADNPRPPIKIVQGD
jgi:hypothetical protein